MRIFLVEHGASVADIVNPVSSYQLDRAEDITHSALMIDQYIFGSRQIVDWVLFTQTTDISFDKFCDLAKYTAPDAKVLFAPNENMDFYYCSPAVFTILANRYKSHDSLFLTLSKQKIDVQWI